MRILVVEDDDLVREYLEVCLVDEGHSVVQAGDAESAVESMRPPSCFDLMVTDFNLDGPMDGVELAGELHLYSPDTPVLFISGRPDLFRQKRRSTDAGEFLVKPFAKRDLLSAIGRAMARAA